MPTTVGIYAFRCSNQRHGWRAFAHHDGERPVSSVSLSADWHYTTPWDPIFVKLTTGCLLGRSGREDLSNES